MLPNMKRPPKLAELMGIEDREPTPRKRQTDAEIAATMTRWAFVMAGKPSKP